VVLVEDEETVRGVLATQPEDSGFRVLTRGPRRGGDREACHGPKPRASARFRALARFPTPMSSVGLRSGARAWTLRGRLSQRLRRLVAEAN
jgi:hypothetical protein